MLMAFEKAVRLKKVAFLSEVRCQVYFSPISFGEAGFFPQDESWDTLGCLLASPESKILLKFVHRGFLEKIGSSCKNLNDRIVFQSGGFGQAVS